MTNTAQDRKTRTEETTGNAHEIIQEAIRFLQGRRKGLRGNARKDHDEWTQELEECGNKLEDHTLTREDVDTFVRRGRRYTGAKPANVVTSTGMPSVWITIQEHQGSQVRAMYALGDMLREEIEAWE